MSYKKQELLSFLEQLGVSLVLWWGPLAHYFFWGVVSFYVVFFALFVFVLSPVPNVARVSVSSVNS